MRKKTKLCILLGVLAAVCVAAFAVSRYEEKKEEIKNSGDVILEVASDDVTALSWTNENGTYSFTKNDDTWTYDDDSAFPVDADKITNLISQFESLSAAFSIENVDDYSQYGLDDPVCTINMTAGDTTYEIKLGNFSSLDEERYVSIGDGNAYLLADDPYDEFDAELKDVVLDDEIPSFDQATQITFSGDEDYTITYNEDGKSICEDDVYFTDDKPLDTDNVNTLLKAIKNLDLSEYVTYNVTDDELATYGLDNPSITISLDYSIEADEKNDVEASSGTVNISVAKNPEEEAAYEEAVENDEDDLPDVTCYARIGDSQIVYKISESSYNSLTSVSYEDLRHQKMFNGDFSTVTSIDVTLNGETYTFTYTPSDEKDEDGTWSYNDEEFTITTLKDALTGITLGTDTDEDPSDQEEISFTLHLDNEDFPTFTATIYRYDGTNCIAVTDDGESFVSRTNTVSIVEAVNSIVLNS